MMKKILLLIGAAFVMLLSSCSEKEYTDVIPRGSTALMSIDLQQTGTDVLQSLLGLSDTQDCGIDISAKLYLFESPDGNMGLVAKVIDGDKLEGIVNDLSEKGVCQKVTQRKDIRFTMVKEAWMMGFDDHAVMLMGPIASAQQTQIQQQIGRYLKQDERQGVTESKMFQKLDSIHSAMALVTQVAALPEQFTAPFMLGAPKTADASQVLLEAELQVQDQMLVIQGQTFSFNQQIDKDLQETATLFRPMEGAFLNRLGTRTALSFLTNVEGKRFLPVLQQNKGLQSLLTGAKFTIDINEVINSVEGDMLLSFSSFSDGNGRMAMHAQRGEKPDYYYSNGEETTPEQSSQALTELLGGQRLAMVLQLNALGDEFAATVSGFLKPLFGDLSTIVYVMCVPEKGKQQE
ncbi:MAG: DUF4836 family protein [Prevotella sp.]|nr:DUF4836 family protein [Prevotella sp.]